MTNSLKNIFATTLVGLTAIVPAAALAQPGPAVSTSASVSVSSSISLTDQDNVCSSTLLKGKHATTAAQYIALGNCAIQNRVTDLNAALTRVQGLDKASATTKTNLVQSIQTTLSSLATIKAKLDADTDVTVAQTDYRSIFTSVRVYALVLPRVWIVASGDRIATIVGELNQVSATLTAKNNALPEGTLKTANANYLADMNAKVADASSKAATASLNVFALVPDNGDATVRASNKATLKASQALIKAAQQDLKVAVQDEQSVHFASSAN